MNTNGHYSFTTSGKISSLFLSDDDDNDDGDDGDNDDDEDCDDNDDDEACDDLSNFHSGINFLRRFLCF